MARRLFSAAVARRVVAVLAGVAFAASGVSAQGRGNGQSGPPGQQRGRGTGRPASPSQVALPPPSTTAGPTSPVPFAWLDDAELIAPGTVWVGLSVMRWQGSGLHEISFPVVTAAAGLSPRVQLLATIPQIARNVNGLNGGLGTAFLGAKIGVLERRSGRVKLAISPTLEILAAPLVGVGESRARWGLPVSIQADRMRTRFFGSSGYFSQGVWYAGGGVGASLARRVGAYVSLSHSRSRADAESVESGVPSRTDVAVGGSFEAASRIGIFGSVGHTIATAAEHGAGLVVSGGVSVFFVPHR